MNDNSTVLNIHDMANTLKVSKSTMRNIINGSNHNYTRPPCFKLGEAWKCTSKDFYAWLRGLSVEEKRNNKQKQRQ